MSTGRQDGRRMPVCLDGIPTSLSGWRGAHPHAQINSMCCCQLVAQPHCSWSGLPLSSLTAAGPAYPWRASLCSYSGFHDHVSVTLPCSQTILSNFHRYARWLKYSMYSVIQLSASSASWASIGIQRGSPSYGPGASAMRESKWFWMSDAFSEQLGHPMSSIVVPALPAYALMQIAWKR